LCFLLRHNRLTRKHKLHDPCLSMSHGTVHCAVLIVYRMLRMLTIFNRLCDATIMLDLNALSTPVNKCLPLDPASLEKEIEKEKKATDNVFYVHSVLVLRQIASGCSSITIPGEDRDVIQLLGPPRPRRPPKSPELLPRCSTSSPLHSCRRQLRERDCSWQGTRDESVTS
jgi:hypothetical protein